MDFKDLHIIRESETNNTTTPDISIGQVVQHYSADLQDTDYVKCDGSIYSRSLYPDLDNILGKGNVLVSHQKEEVTVASLTDVKGVWCLNGIWHVNDNNDHYININPDPRAGSWVKEWDSADGPVVGPVIDMAVSTYSAADPIAIVQGGTSLGDNRFFFAHGSDTDNWVVQRSQGRIVTDATAVSGDNNQPHQTPAKYVAVGTELGGTSTELSYSDVTIATNIASWTHNWTGPDSLSGNNHCDVVVNEGVTVITLVADSGGTSKIFRSPSFGGSFTEVYDSGSASRLFTLEAIDSDTLVATPDDGTEILISRDNGQNWELGPTTPDISAFETEPTDPHKSVQIWSDKPYLSIGETSTAAISNFSEYYVSAGSSGWISTAAMATSNDDEVHGVTTVEPRTHRVYHVGRHYMASNGNGYILFADGTASVAMYDYTGYDPETQFATPNNVLHETPYGLDLFYNYIRVS